MKLDFLLTVLKDAGLTPDQICDIMKTILFLGGVVIVIVIIGLGWYFHRLLSIYSQRVDAVMEWNKKFLLPMYFKYSWLKGVEIGIHEKGTADQGSNAPKNEKV
jgi:hypothetical protein